MRILLSGNFRELSSFSVINRQLVGALRRRGHRVDAFACDGRSPSRANPPPPDVFVAHGHPWRADTAPGRLNVFALNYEYLTADGELRELITRLNAAFDLVIVPAPFARPVLAAAGLRLPVEVVPWGYDPAEFHPGVRPLALPTAKSLVFMYVGAVNQRKGTDALLAAYRAEFSAADDVALVIKESMRHPTWERWSIDLRDRYLDGVGTDERGAAEVVWLRGASRSVARYFAAADVGVFPHRGEGFGLPILECIASGRPVIVTVGTGPAAFCNRRNSRSIRARRVRRGDALRLEPDTAHLGSLLRDAYERGKAARPVSIAVSRSVRGWTWEHSAAALETVLRRYRTRRQPVQTRPPSRRRAAVMPRLAYAFHSRGVTSWRKHCTEIDRSLAARFHGYRSFTHRDRIELREVDIAIGQSEHCLELLLAARRHNPGAITVVHQECTVLGDRQAILNRERRRCGLAPIAIDALHVWRNRLENDLADHFIVASSVAARAFQRNGFAPSAIHVIPHGIRCGRMHYRGPAAKTRFLFVGTDPLRKGIRQLLAAWERASLPQAELICLMDPEVLQSKLLLRYLVRNPTIILRRLVPHRTFLRQYDEVDCQVLPSLEDTFSMAVADGMGVGKPAIVSTETGIQDLITDGVNGRVVPAGDVDALAAALQEFASDRRRLRAMGAAAYETARQYPWRRFRRTVGELVASIWAQAR